MADVYNIIVCCIGVSIISLNTILLIALYKKSGSQFSSYDFILFSFTSANLLQGILTFPAKLIRMTETEYKTDGFCIASAFLMLYLCIVAIWHLVLLSLERYFAMKYPLIYMELSPKSHWRIAAVSLPWLIGTVWAGSPLIGWSSYKLEFISRSRCNIDMTSTSVNALSYTIMLLLFNFAIPIFVFIFCYVKVHAELREMFRIATVSNGKTSTIAKETRKSEKTQTTLVFVMVINFLVSWTPYAIVVLLQITIRNVPMDIFEISALFAKTSCFSNSICYGFIYKNIRVAARSLFQKKKSRRNQVEPITQD